MSNIDAGFEIERLYGVVPECSISSFDFYIPDKGVKPSPELLADLKSLSPGTTVGIECFDPNAIGKDELEINGKKISIINYGKAYWKKIMQACHSARLNVAFLDDPEILREWAEKSTICEDLMEKSVGIRTRSSAYYMDPEERSLFEANYKVNVEAEFIKEAKKTEVIAQRILQYQPKRVILSQKHADCLVADWTSLAESPLKIANYQIERVDTSINARFSPRLLPAYLSFGSGPNPKNLLDRKLLVRAHNAVTKGRILPDQEPDFIGTWDVNCRPRGLFEVYVDHDLSKKIGSTAGFIEDSYGTAIFRVRGERSEDHISFVKEYIHTESAPEAANGEISYEAICKDGRYEGNYFLSPPNTYEGEKFFMNKGSKLNS